MRNRTEIGRRQVIPVMLPHSIKTDSDNDLRLDLVTLKNAHRE